MHLRKSFIIFMFESVVINMFYKHLYKLPQKGQVLLNVIRKNIVIFECVNIMQSFILCQKTFG